MLVALFYCSVIFANSAELISSIMSVLEKLSPFISICQFCGMLPFSMEYDPTTKAFARFSFSFRNFITWWFMLIFILQLAAPFALVNISGHLLQELSSDLSVPTMVTIVAGVTSVCFFAQFAISRWITFRHYGRLRNAVEAVQAVERILKSLSVIVCNNSVTKRVVIGIILLLAAVSLQGAVSFATSLQCYT